MSCEEEELMPSEQVDTTKSVKRLNATLPDQLAQFVGEITGEGGLYETPSEFIRDLIRRYMENTRNTETQEINNLLARSLAENNYSPWTKDDLQDIRNHING